MVNEFSSRFVGLKYELWSLGGMRITTMLKTLQSQSWKKVTIRTQQHMEHTAQSQARREPQSR